MNSPEAVQAAGVGLGRGWDMGTLRFVDIIDLSAYSKPKYAFFVHFHAKWTKQGK